MDRFLAKHDTKIQAVLSCFDRVIFKGYLPFTYPKAMEIFLHRQGILLKDFRQFVKDQSEAVKDHAMRVAVEAGRPYEYLNDHDLRKDNRAYGIAARDQITDGLVCVFAILESCRSFRLAYGEGRPRLVPHQPRALCLYFYFMDRQFGLMHVRIQTWFPFTIQVYVNGHEWLELMLKRHDIAFQKFENVFLRLENLPRVQRIANRFVRLKWPRILEALAKKVNPHIRRGGLLEGRQHYWVVDQAEYATDIAFRDPASLKRLYEKLLRHATLCFSAEDVMTFLGRRIHGHFKGEIQTICQKRWPGARIKHRVGGNWIKMYDKFGCVLRVETVINRPHEFKVRRTGKRDGRIVRGWFPMRKQVCNLYRYAEICLSANKRYLDALSVVDDPAASYAILKAVCEPASRDGLQRRGLNPIREDDLLLFSAALRGEHFLHGFRNRDLARHLGIKLSKDPILRRRQGARVGRLLQLLRAHGLIAKIPRTRRYKLTHLGVIVMSAAVHLHEDDLPARLTKGA